MLLSALSMFGYVAAITYTTPDGHRVDGFSADIETRAQGVNVAPDTARATLTMSVTSGLSLA